MLEYVSLAILILLIFVITFAILKLAAIPGKVANSKAHPQEDAIRVCGWLGLVTGGVTWVVALVWAYTRPILPAPSSDDEARSSGDVPREMDEQVEETKNEKEPTA